MSRKNFVILESGVIKLSSLTAIEQGSINIDTTFDTVSGKKFRETACGHRISSKRSNSNGNKDYCVDAYLFVNMVMRVFEYFMTVGNILDKEKRDTIEHIDNMIRKTTDGVEPFPEHFIQSNIKLGYDNDKAKICKIPKRSPYTTAPLN
jgi:hypothetical protein